MKRICTVCGEEFKPNHGNQKFCSKECLRIKQKEWNRHYYQEHKKEKKKYFQKYYQEHKKEKREYSQKYYQEHKKEKREYSHKYYQEHKEKLLDYARKKRKPQCLELGYSCLECPYEDCRY